jgi:RNA polymerase sigma-70 factor (ECF subfamily)
LDKSINGMSTPREMVERYKNTVFRIAYAYCRNRSDAEDVFQEVFLRYFRKSPSFSDSSHEKAWFIKVTVNCCKKLCLSSWYKKMVPLEEDISFETREESELYYAVMELPLKYRIAVHLYYYEDYNIRQIAKMTNQKETTVATQLQRARQHLKSKLKEELIYG